MIISRVIGGLGNQMFQYAVGRAVSLVRNVPLRLDISGFANYGLHQWIEFQRIFNCTAEIANEGDVRRILGWQSSARVRGILSRRSITAFRKKGFIVEPHHHYWQGIRDVPHDCYLMGYWQSEKYFLDVASVIRSHFTFKFPPVNRNADIVDLINQVSAVSLHVRRGDYANNPDTTATHGLCSLEYYHAAIQYIAERVKQPEFLIFSDDVEWVKDNLKIKFPSHYVDHNHGAESYNDMRLMSLCQHHIIANSSFSWWGAWLNPSTKKIVIAPKRWFANKTDVRDSFSQGWVTL